MIVYRSKATGRDLIVLDHGQAQYYEDHGGAPEQDLIDWTLEEYHLNRRGGCGLFVDVGAHCGTWSFAFASMAVRVIAFEAQRSTYDQLCGGIALNDLSERVIAHHLAVSERSGEEVDLNVNSLCGGTSSIADVMHRYPTLRTERVKTTCLDDHDLAGVNLIKIDVEGAELQVLKGARRTLKEHRPHVILESWAEPKEDREALFAFLRELNYDVVPINRYSEMFLGVPQ